MDGRLQNTIILNVFMICKMTVSWVFLFCFVFYPFPFSTQNTKEGSEKRLFWKLSRQGEVLLRKGQHYENIIFLFSVWERLTGGCVKDRDEVI